eukprot:gene16359-biopygen25319
MVVQSGRVLVLKNTCDGIVNGTLGKIIGFQFDDNVPEDLLKVAVTNAEGMRILEGMSNGTFMWPVVKVELADGTITSFIAKPKMFTLDDSDGNMINWRFQILLLYAYALTVHKAQGMTLKHVVVDVSNAFCHGKVYVALSRCSENVCLKEFPSFIRCTNYAADHSLPGLDSVAHARTVLEGLNDIGVSGVALSPSGQDDADCLICGFFLGHRHLANAAGRAQ